MMLDYTFVGSETQMKYLQELYEKNEWTPPFEEERRVATTTTSEVNNTNREHQLHVPLRNGRPHRGKKMQPQREAKVQKIYCCCYFVS